MAVLAVLTLFFAGRLKRNAIFCCGCVRLAVLAILTLFFAGRLKRNARCFFADVSGRPSLPFLLYFLPDILSETPVCLLRMCPVGRPCRSYIHIFCNTSSDTPVYWLRMCPDCRSCRSYSIFCQTSEAKRPFFVADVSGRPFSPILLLYFLPGVSSETQLFCCGCDRMAVLTALTLFLADISSETPVFCCGCVRTAVLADLTLIFGRTSQAKRPFLVADVSGWKFVLTVLISNFLRRTSKAKLPFFVADVPGLPFLPFLQFLLCFLPDVLSETHIFCCGCVRMGVLTVLTLFFCNTSQAKRPFFVADVSGWAFLPFLLVFLGRRLKRNSNFLCCGCVRMTVLTVLTLFLLADVSSETPVFCCGYVRTAILAVLTLFFGDRPKRNALFLVADVSGWPFLPFLLYFCRTSESKRPFLLRMRPHGRSYRSYFLFWRKSQAKRPFCLLRMCPDGRSYHYYSMFWRTSQAKLQFFGCGCARMADVTVLTLFFATRLKRHACFFLVADVSGWPLLPLLLYVLQDVSTGTPVFWVADVSG